MAKLALAKFIYNNLVYIIISLILFYLLYNFNLELNINIRDAILKGGALVVKERI
jgi:small neutral amino acid transporter SnatA (MarC family)